MTRLANRRKQLTLVCLCLLLVWGTVPTRAQQSIPISVFVAQDREAQTATVTFTNPITGLSSPVIINNFPADQLAVEAFTVTQAGVIYRDAAGGVQLITPRGDQMSHPFIPQNTGEIFTVDWVASQDGGRIVWVETRFIDGTRVEAAYSVDAFGAAITPLPSPDVSEIDPFRRLKPIWASSTDETVYFDAAFPLEARPLTQYFATFQSVLRYENGVYTSLDAETTHCPCPLGASDEFLLWLQPTGQGIQADLFDLNANFEDRLPPIADVFGQAGDSLLGETVGFYTQAQNLDDPSAEVQFRLVQVELLSRQQRILPIFAGGRYRPMALVNDEATLIVVDVYNGGTYKYQWRSQALDLTSESTWLGDLPQLP
jgi:hypothetical protein